MNQFYAMIGISKQAHYKRVSTRSRQSAIQEQFIVQARALRKEHRKLGCRKIYWEVLPEGMGRDKAEAVLLQNGFRVPKKRRYTRTTYAGQTRYPNRINGLELNGIDQLWVSDMTYIPVGYKKNYYLTLIQDVYSRHIVGWSLSAVMSTQQSVLKAYKRAIARRKGKVAGLIFHSDRGSQYGSDCIKEEHKKHGVLASMGNKAWENAHAESLNGLLKNEYIELPENGISLKQANKQMERWIYLYNHKRPHGSLKRRKPIKYETYLQGLALEDRPIVTIKY